MSARAVTLWFSDTEDPNSSVRAGLTQDVDAARALGSSIYRDNVLVPIADTTLAVAAAATDAHVYAGAYGPLSVVSCSLFATPRPSTLTRTVNAIRPGGTSTLLYTDPASATGAFARWEGGELRRSFSATPTDILEDVGLPYVFEKPFWAGEHPLRYADGVEPEPLALPFHPQHLAEQSNRTWFGFRFTHPLSADDLDPARIPVTVFAIHPADYTPTDADLHAYRAGAGAPAGPSTPVPTAPQDTGHPPRRGRLARYFGFGKQS